jgi:hypothetical protein
LFYGVKQKDSNKRIQTKGVKQQTTKQQTIAIIFVSLSKEKKGWFDL